MKNKVVKILSIATIIILMIGTLCFIGADEIIDEYNTVTHFMSLLGCLTLKLMIIAYTLGIISLIWLIYGVIILVKKIKQRNLKKQNLIIIILLVFFFMFSVKPFISLTSVGNSDFTKKNYNYNIQCQEDSNIYNIYKTNGKVEVYIQEQPICIKAPCNTIERIEKIKFSNKNMIIVNNFIDYWFQNQEHNSILIFRENLNNEQNKILNSIIYNNEKLLD